MTGLSSMYASHTAGTAKAPDECQKCTSAGRETINAGVADETTQGQTSRDGMDGH